MLPQPLLWNSLPSRLPAAGPVELPHLLHPSPTCNAHQGAWVLRLGANTFDPLVWGLSLAPVPFHRTQLPPTQTSNAVKGPALERGRFLQFNCNGILHCHAELQDFLLRHQVLVVWVQETKLGVNSSLKEFTDYALSGAIARPGVAVVDLSPSSTTPSAIGCLTVASSPMMTRRKFWQSRSTSGKPYWPSSMFTSSLHLPALGTTPLTMTLFWKTVETRWRMAPHHPSWFSRTGDDRAAARGEAFATVRNSLLRTKISLLDSPPRTSPSRQMSPFSAGISSPMWHGPPSQPLGSDHLPIIVSLSSHAPSSPRKARSFTNFRKVDWEGYTAESARGGLFWNPPTALPIPNVTGPYCASWEARGRIPYRIFQLPSMEKTHSSPKAIARAFDRQFIACSAQQDRAIRRLTTKLDHHHRVDPSYRPFDEGGVAAAIRKVGSSTTQGPDRLTMLHLCHLGPHGLAFLAELFNLSVAGINFPAIWKKSVIIRSWRQGRLVSRAAPIAPSHCSAR